MDAESSDAARDRRSDIIAKVNESRQKMARTAESTARTAERSAEVHAALVGSLPGAGEHAARDRRLADAERTSAASLRRGEPPPEAARQVIRSGGRVPGEQAGPGASAPAAESDSVRPDRAETE